MTKRKCLFLLPFVTLFSVACTTVGVGDRKEQSAIDYGAPVTVRVCVLRDPSVPERRVGELMSALRAELAPYGVSVDVARSEVAPRGGYTVWGIMGSLQSAPLPAGCDYLIKLVGRHALDTAWLLLPLPEVLGAVDAIGGRRLYAVATTTSVSLNQRVSPPESIITHEFYHLLGCTHALSMRQCYNRVAEWKRERARSE